MSEEFERTMERRLRRMRRRADRLEVALCRLEARLEKQERACLERHGYWQRLLHELETEVAGLRRNGEEES